MVVKHMAEDEKPTAVVSKADDFVLKSFWTLSEGNDKARIKASDELVKYLKQKQEIWEESNEQLCPPLTYSLERLVKGLSSGRKWSRLGFSLVLTQIMRNLEMVSVKHVLNLVNSHLQYTSHDHRAETGGVMLGQAFVYLSLIQSERLFKGESKEFIGRVLRSFIKLGREKMYLLSVCSQGLTLLIQKCTSKVFRKRILPNVEELKSGWKTCSIDRLLLVLTCARYHMDEMKDLLDKHWNGSLVSKHGFKFITDILKNSNIENKVYVQICQLLVDLIEEKLISQLWTDVGAPLIHGNQQHKQIAACLFICLLKKTTCPKQVEEIINRDSREFLTMVPGSIYIKLSKEKMHEAIIEKVKSSHDEPDIQLAIVRSLLRDPGGPSFDHHSKSHTFSVIVRELSDIAYKKYFHIVETVLTGGSIDGFSPNEVKRCKKKAAYLLKLKTVHGADQTKLIKLLFLHGYFTVTNPTSDMLHCNKTVIFDEEELQMLQNGCTNTLCYVRSGDTVNHSSHKKQHLQTLIDVFNYAQELLQNASNVSTRKKLSNKELEAWNQAVITVTNITDKDEKKKTPEDEAFLYLFLHFGLQIITEKTKLDLSLLEDVHSCYKKASSKKKIKSSAEEPEWIEVLTEVLLSMMSQSSHMARVMASTTFKMLTHHVTPAVIDQIMNVMYSKMGDDGPIKFEDDENDDDDGDEEEDDASDDDEEDDDSDDDSDDDDDDEKSSSEDELDGSKTETNKKKVNKQKKENGHTKDKKPLKKKITEESDSDSDEEDKKPIKKKKKKAKKVESDDDMDEVQDFDEGFRQTVKAALGDAAVNSDYEGSDSDLNDSDMERMDAKLTEAFKSMRKTSRKKAGIEAEKQFIAFKIRVIDLLQIVVKSDITAQVAVSLVHPLLKIIHKAERKDSQRELYVRTKKTVEILYTQKHMRDVENVDKEWLLKTLQELFQFAAKVTNLIIVKEISNGVLYLFKLFLVESKSDAQTKVMDFLKQNLSFFLYNKKEYRFHPALFTNMFTKFPKLFWTMKATLIDVLQNDRIKVYNKTLATGFISTLLQKKPCLELKPKEWKEFENEILPLLKKFLLAFDVKENYKPKFLEELLNICFKMLQISPALKQHFGEDIQEKLSSLKPKFCKNTRQVYNRFRSLVIQSAGKRSRRMDRNKNKSKPTPNGDSSVNNGDSTVNNGDAGNTEETPEITPKSTKKMKKKKGDQQESEINENKNDEDMDVDNSDTVKTPKVKKHKKRKSDEFIANGEISPASEKKLKLSQSFHFEMDADFDVDDCKKSKKKAKKRKASL